jgi:hypothetical protein
VEGKSGEDGVKVAVSPSGVTVIVPAMIGVT